MSKKIKYTPDSLVEARKNPMIKKWRASNRNGTLINNPTIKELLSMKDYQRKCQSYINLLMRVIIAKEIRMDVDLDLKPAEYYFKRYDVTAVECKILRNEIYNKL